MNLRGRTQPEGPSRRSILPAARAQAASNPQSATGQRITALQRAAGNRATLAQLQRQFGVNPRNMAIRSNPKIQSDEAAQAEREAAAKKKQAEEFNAARATIESDPRYQQMQADASSKTAKFLDLVSSALKGSMASAWEEGDKAGQYEGDSAGSFAGPSAGLDAYMEGNDQAYELAVQMGSAHRDKQSEQEGQMAIDMAGKIIPGGGGMLADAAKFGGKVAAGQAIKQKQATETIKVNKVLMRYLLGTPAQTPQGPIQQKYEAARQTVAAKFSSHLRSFAEIEEVDSETLPDFKFATEETQTEVDSETDWDAIPTRGRR